MKKLKRISSTIVVLMILFPAIKVVAKTGLEIGDSIPSSELKMKDVGGSLVSLNEVKDTNGLLVVFSCNTCPYVVLSESRIKEMAGLAKSNKIGVIIVNSNAARHNGVDSFEAMKEYATAQAFDFSYVLDEKSRLADAFGAKRTPQCFLFDNKGLAYQGAIDDNVKDIKEVKDHYLKDALNAVGAGEPIKITSSKSIGCSIKRLEQ